ncbi:sigma factor-like helix-turn-helix DNA-binding protein [Streptoalloteichus hindustanus]|uniref:sigma factor-like helix-turn-helix DNA-binding protein n=1 Tax=Streptoalloteichus hindustanus TaxID=2017 RepID=UPI000935EE92|nr:sigma factor-like helix-turn-helix DNA-binding protein [Streptoalloteichus hindustanus]
MTSSLDEVTRWALRARTGDAGAWERLVRATQRDVWRFVAHLAGVGPAGELTQRAYARAVAESGRPCGQSSARTWLLAITRRVVREHRPSPSGVDRLGGFPEVERLNALLDGLATDRREALVLTQVLGLSYVDAAEALECPVGTVRALVARAREDLVRAVDQRAEAG